MFDVTRMEKWDKSDYRDIQIKLRSNVGETIGETLVGLLIAAFAMLMLAGAISATANMIRTSDNKLKEYYQTDKVLAEKSDGESGTLEITIYEGSDTIQTQEDIPYFKNDSFGSAEVIAY